MFNRITAEFLQLRSATSRISASINELFNRNAARDLSLMAYTSSSQSSSIDYANLPGPDFSHNFAFPLDTVDLVLEFNKEIATNPEFKLYLVRFFVSEI